MKLFKLTYGLMAAMALSLASCSLNDEPEFNDADAFVAIQKTSAAIAETGKTLEIPVMLTSLAGQQGSVDFVITPDSVAGAIENTHYTIGNESKTLTFTKENPVQNIIINVKDNDIFEGDVKFTIELTNVQGAKFGANKKCVVTIEDDEHPLAFILGTLTAKGESYFNGDTEWSVTIEKDADDLNKVWIGNLVPDGSNQKVYATVNSQKTEIHIPVGQLIAKTSSYPTVNLDAFYGDHSQFGIDDGHTTEAEEDIEAGGYITGLIAADGTITLIDWFGSCIYTDGVAGSWFDIMTSGVVMKK